MTEEESLEEFSRWYEKCIQSGIEPEKIVARMGGMALITDELLIEKLVDDGIIPPPSD